MSANNLLTWMSMRQQGSWSQFRDAVERFQLSADPPEIDGDNVPLLAVSDLPSYQTVSFDLQRLAHAEFFFSGSAPDWRVVPPSLALHKRADKWCGIVCGARSPEFVRTVQMNELFEVTECDAMPDKICLSCTDWTSISETAATLGLIVQQDAPETILAALPRVNDQRQMHHSEPPPSSGWVIEKFSCSSLEWTKCLEREKMEQTVTGLFRYTSRYKRLYYLRWRNQTFSINAMTGKYAVLSVGSRVERQLLRFDREKELLSLPFQCRPPILMERALVLCSGQLPECDWSSSRIIYKGISTRIARLATALLCQELSEI